MSEEIDYKEQFKNYCIDYSSKEPDSIREAQWKFALDNKDEAFELFQSVYDQTYGTIHIDENLVSIHTGGWSENESIIYEFKKTFWWTSNFWCNIRGGHYYFETEQNGKKEWDIVKKENINLVFHNRVF